MGYLDERAMKKPRKCPYCLTEMYQDDHDTWFCPDCILEDIDAAFLNPNTDDPGELKKPYILKPPTKQISIRLAVSDLELARKLEPFSG